MSDGRTFPESDVPIAPLTTLGVGGHAAFYTRATSIGAVQDAWTWASARGVEILVLGGGSNLVLADAGWPGLVLHMAVSHLDATRTGASTRLTCGAGVGWDDVVAASVSRGLAGLECLSGIPGTAGGTPVQNVGAYGQEVADVIAYVQVLDRWTGSLRTLAAAECGFGYRSSRFKAADAGRFIVCEVAFTLAPGVANVSYPDVTALLRERASMAPTVHDVRSAVLDIRRRKGMVIDATDPDTRSVGSFFTNPVVDPKTRDALAASTGAAAPWFPSPGGGIKIPAAWLIEQAGFPRGFNSGPVGLSGKHPLAIVNRGGATARDVIGLAARIKRQVADRFGILLTSEPVFAGFRDDPEVAYLMGEV